MLKRAGRYGDGTRPAMTDIKQTSRSQMKIPLVDVRAQTGALQPELGRIVDEVLDGGVFVGGAYVQRFESEFARFCEVPHCVGVGNGTDALELALRALGVGPGDEVITVPLTFFATAEAIVNVGARPVFVDVDPATCLMDVDHVEKALTARTTAVVPVHLYGQPCDMERLEELTRSRGLRLVGDAAQAHGARWRGRAIASFGDAATFSFYPGKNLGALGDGGAVLTRSEGLAAEVRRLANHGRQEKYLHGTVGRNSRLDALQAAVLSLKLTRLAGWNRQRSEVAGRYLSLMRDQPIRLPVTAPEAEHAWHLFTVRTPERDRLQEALRAAQIETVIHYPVPLHLQPALAGQYGSAGAFPASEEIAVTTLSIPLFPELSEQAQQSIIDVIAATLLGRRPTSSAQVRSI
jgi:dTDP-4-amino-4,6-dideoxygalactose transaminase